MSETTPIETAASDEMAPAGTYWWLVLLAGACTCVLGLLLLFRPFDSLAALALLVGLFLMISGVASLLSSHRREYGIGLAVLSLIIGVVLFAWPDITVQALAVVGGIGIVVRSILRAIIAVTDRTGSWVALLVVSLLGIAAGIAVIAWPDVTVAVVGVVIGAGALFTGIGEIVAAFELKNEA
jgi:uncharacterized membrane protein HdeD (DUF308 family)